MLRRRSNDRTAPSDEVAWPADPDGQLISDAFADRLSSHRPCPACGARRTPGVRFCPNCGTDLDDARNGRFGSWSVRRRVTETAAPGAGARTAGRGAAGARATSPAPRPQARFVVGEGLIALTGRQILGLGLLVGIVAGGLATLIGH